MLEVHIEVYHPHDAVLQDSQELQISYQTGWSLGRFRGVTEVEKCFVSLCGRQAFEENLSLYKRHRH